ncbi:MAG: hypothetical protein ACE5PV_14265, partial [Candidatus Poribacteria bacterium]
MEEPDTPQAEKHFLDTSVARPILVGTRQYKAYFAAEFGDNLCYTKPPRKPPLSSVRMNWV